MSGQASEDARPRIGLRIAFAVLLFLLPAELLLRNALADEPYPGLYLPNFGPVPDQDGTVEYRTRTVEVELGDGSTVVIDGGNLLTGSGGGAIPFARLLGDPANIDVDTVDWLRGSLESAYPHLDVVWLSIVADDWSFDKATGERTLLGSETENRIEVGGEQ